MRVFGLIALLFVGVGVHLWSVRSAHAEQSAGEPIVLQVGDEVQVSGAPVGCKLIARDGGRFLDCRVAGTLAGSYGTLMTGKRLQVVRFRNARVAKVVFDATQHGGFKVCH